MAVAALEGGEPPTSKAQRHGAAAGADYAARPSDRKTARSALREAAGLVNAGVEDANTVIEFLNILSGDIVLSSTIDIQKSVAIEGLGESVLAIDGGGTVQLFTVNGSAGTTVSFYDLTIEGGYSKFNSRSGGISDYSVDVSIDSVTFDKNEGGRVVQYSTFRTFLSQTPH